VGIRNHSGFVLWGTHEFFASHSKPAYAEGSSTGPLMGNGFIKLSLWLDGSNCVS